MVYGHRYIQVEKSGRVSGSCADPVEGATVDTKGVDVPEMPTDAIYALYYNEEKGLYYVSLYCKRSLPCLSQREGRYSRILCISAVSSLSKFERCNGL